MCCVLTGSQFAHSASHSIAADRRLLQLCTERSCILRHCSNLATQLRCRQLHQAHRCHHGVAHCATESRDGCQRCRHDDRHIWRSVVQQGNDADSEMRRASCFFVFIVYLIILPETNRRT